MARLGPLLKRALARIDAAGNQYRQAEISALAAHTDMDADTEQLPVVMQLRRNPIARGESWSSYKARCDEQCSDLLARFAGDDAQMLYAANAISGKAYWRRVTEMAETRDAVSIELDPLVNATFMDDAVIDIGLPEFRTRVSPSTGEGVRVAVLDSGIDASHPYLDVLESVTTSGEDVRIPGSHGTHCAGSVASRDTVFPGVAPGVSLLNVKVLRHDGSGTFSSIVQGIDQALDLEAQVMSMSVGFNHLPPWSDGGHGWRCPDGRCPLCTAVDNAYRFGAVACVAAGNEHLRAEALRGLGEGRSFDTELGCPGQARSAITVGALTKRTFQPAEFTSRGPSAYGLEKPDLAAPGVNVMSTVPVPRQADGTCMPEPGRAELFTRLSGTSMATPIVAGCLALLIEERQTRGLSVAPAALRKALLSEAVSGVTALPNVVGRGRLDLSVYGTIIPA